MINEITLDNEKVRMIKQYDEQSNKSINKIILPEITDEELLKRYKQITPILNIENIYYKLRNLDLYRLKHYSYTQDRFQTEEDIVLEDNILTIGDFSCYHIRDFYGLFKPTIYEVLSQFPDIYLKDANAFYIYEAPRTKEELEKQKDIISAGYYKTKVKAFNIKK